MRNLRAQGMIFIGKLNYVRYMFRFHIDFNPFMFQFNIRAAIGMVKYVVFGATNKNSLGRNGWYSPIGKFPPPL